MKKEPIVHLANLDNEDPLKIPKERFFDCDFCEMSFFDKDKLRNHVISTHEGKKTYKCSHCNGNFLTKPKLLVHVRSFHEGKGPFFCTISTNDFTQKSELRNYMKRHEKTKYFKQKNN